MDIRKLKQKGKYFYPMSVTSAIYDPNIKDTNEQLLSQEEINKTIYSNIEDIQSDTTNIKEDLNTTKDRVSTIETNNINDIQIDGESIVDTQIANIDYLKKGDQILIKADTDTVHAIVISGKVDLGDSNTVGTSKQAAIGFDNTLAGDKGHSYTLGEDNNVSGGYTTVVGIKNTDTKPSVNGFKTILGYNNTSSGYSGIIAGIGNSVTSDYNNVIGKENIVGSSKSTVVGISNTLDNKDVSNNIFGESNIVNGDYNIISGRNNKVNVTNRESSGDCVVYGLSNTVNNSKDVIVIGSSNQVTDAEDYVHICIGSDNTILNGFDYVNVGNYNLMQNVRYTQVLGVDNSIMNKKAAGISYFAVFGQSNDITIDANFTSYDAYHTCIGFDNDNTNPPIYTTVLGNRLTVTNATEMALGCYNKSTSGSTIFSIGNGFDSTGAKTRHNLLEANQDGDLYIVEKTNTDGDTTNYYERPMKRLQTWLNEKADLNSLDNYSKKITTTSSSDLAVTLKPNTNVDITCNSNLTITLEAPTDESVVNVYMCTLTTGEDSGTVTVLANVIWNEEITIEANSFYEINIRYSGGSYFGIIHKWDNGLPSGYKKLEYIENTSQAYIDTGVDGGHFNKVYHKFILTEITGTWINIWGTRNGSTAQGRALFINVDKKCFGVNHNSVNTISTIPCNTAILYQVTYNNGTFRINDQTLVYDAATFSNTKNCRLFQLNDATTPLDDIASRKFARMKCYSFKMWQDDTLVRDFVPARQLSDNKVGMWDKVEGKFYSSAHDGYEFKGSDEYIKLVDLGLTSGTLWADRNVGANKVIDYGLHYAWGETDGYSDVTTDKQFNWTDYKYANGDYNKLTKYCNNSSYGNDSYTDKLTTLETTDDASYSVDTFVMPTKAQLQELIDETTYTWTTKDGVAGGLFASKVNSNSIFIPASGGCFYSTLKNVGEQGNIWSSSLYEASPNYAWLMRFNSSGVSINHFSVSRCDGCSIRGVKV